MSNNAKLSAFGISPSDKTNNEEYLPASSHLYSIKAGVLTPFIADHTPKASPSTGIILSVSSCTKSQETTFNNTDFGDILPELQTVAGKRALILRGNGGRELLGETLRERGANVTFVECYQRCAKHYDGAEEAMRWHARGINTLVVTSGEMLQQLWALIPLWYRENWLLRCRLLVVSERLANQARELGWQDIRIADNADNDALLRALK